MHLVGDRPLSDSDALLQTQPDPRVRVEYEGVSLMCPFLLELFGCLGVNFCVIGLAHFAIKPFSCFVRFLVSSRLSAPLHFLEPFRLFFYSRSSLASQPGRLFVSLKEKKLQLHSIFGPFSNFQRIPFASF